MLRLNYRKWLCLLSLSVCFTAGCAGGEDSDEAALLEPEEQQPSTQFAVLSEPAFITGVNVHNYPKPASYGYLASDGGDRMGAAIGSLGVHYVRGAIIGDTTFLARLKSFGVSHALLGLDAKAFGKPFDPAKLKAALTLSVNEARRLGIEVIAEGLNEWDLFNVRPYNAGVVPSGTSNSAFIALTQRALYEAAHPLGIRVLGPSVGHPHEQTALNLFPDVSAYVDIVNMHFYFGTNPETLPVAQYVLNHQRFQGAGKPVWVTETGTSAYNGVTWAKQADLISRGFTTFANSGLIQAAFNYELLDTDRAGWRGWSYTFDSAELHFGLFNYYGQPKTSAGALTSFIASH